MDSGGLIFACLHCCNLANGLHAVGGLLEHLHSLTHGLCAALSPYNLNFTPGERLISEDGFGFIVCATQLTESRNSDRTKTGRPIAFR